VTEKDDAKYERELVLHLRMRGQSEAEIASSLTELRAYANKSGKPIEDAFGTPAEFASQFPIRNSPTTKGGALRKLFGAAFRPSPKAAKNPDDPEDAS
jgi:hypothetical protein